MADYIFAQEPAQAQAAQPSGDWGATGDPYFSETYVSKIKAVQPQDIKRVAQKYFKKETMTLVVIKPPRAKAESKEALTPASAVQTEIEKIVLPNRMTLLLQRNSSTPIVSFQFFAKGGLRLEPADKPGVSHFMASLLTKGTKNRSNLPKASLQK